MRRPTDDSGRTSSGKAHLADARNRYSAAPGRRRILVDGAAVDRQRRLCPRPIGTYEVRRSDAQPRRPFVIQQLERIAHETKPAHPLTDAHVVADFRHRRARLEADEILGADRQRAMENRYPRGEGITVNEVSFS